MKQPRVSLNVTIAFLEILVVSVVLFFLYRFLYDQVGIKTIGVWSLVLATTSFGNLAGFGFPRSLVYYLPSLIRKGQKRIAVLYIETAFISITAFLVVLCALLYYPLYQLLSLAIDEPEPLALGRELLPWALGSLVMVNISFVFISSVKGLQLNFMSSMIVIVANGVYFCMSIWLVPQYGIIAMAWSQMVQIAITIILCFIVLKRHLKELPYFPKRLSKKTFRKIASYGFKAQYIAFVVLFYQPLTKYMLGIYSTLELVGYYEFALKFVQNVSKMITNANNALTPTFSHLGTDASKRRELFLKANAVTWLIAPVMMGGLLALTPFVSVLWIGKYVDAFFFFTLIVGGSNIVSVMASPSYSLGMGAGQLRGNIIGQTVIGVANMVFGMPLGYLYGAYGVAIGSAAALILGNLYILYNNSRRITGGLPYTTETGIKSLILLACVGAGVWASHFVYMDYMQDRTMVELFFALGIAFTLIILPISLIHPGFHDIWRVFTRKKRKAVI